MEKIRNVEGEIVEKINHLTRKVKEIMGKTDNDDDDIMTMILKMIRYRNSD